MNSATKKKDRSHRIAILCALLYFTSYMTRKSFSAIKLGLPDSLDDIVLGNIGSALFFAYGIGQIISGILADRTKPEYLIYTGLFLSAASNLLFPVLIENSLLLTVIWGVNGFAQALFWPPILQIISKRCAPESYQSACTTVSIGGQSASLLIYFVAAGLIAIDAWRVIFYIAAALTVPMALLLLFLLPRNNFSEEFSTKPQAETMEKPQAKRGSLGRFFIASGIIFVALSLITTGFLRDGIDEWLPKFLSDVFSIGDDISTLSVVLSPVIGILFVKLTPTVNRRLFHGCEVLMSAVLFTVAALLSVCICFTRAFSPILSLILFVLITGFMHSANTCLTCFTPRRFEKYGRLSTGAGIVNAAVYIGSTLATTLLPVIFNAKGWNIALLVFAAVSVVGAIFSAVLIKPYRKDAQA